ncbi:hypothetical protein [Streptomyces sp. NPDC047097]|uniref:hypothetical protein n=1 Tax=Streptomyces sp. NPDC047097 TaxID=3155260 RepID=UPI0033E490A2
MRPAHDGGSGHVAPGHSPAGHARQAAIGHMTGHLSVSGSVARSATPIYDALYSEYLRSFRTLPFDRSGEEDLGFRSFGTGSGGYAAQHAGFGGGGWQQVGPVHRGGHHHVPAALPPAPRRGL